MPIICESIGDVCKCCAAPKIHYVYNKGTRVMKNKANLYEKKSNTGVCKNCGAPTVDDTYKNQALIDSITQIIELKRTIKELNGTIKNNNKESDN